MLPKLKKGPFRRGRECSHTGIANWHFQLPGMKREGIYAKLQIDGKVVS